MTPEPGSPSDARSGTLGSQLSPERPAAPALLCITPSPAIDRTAHVERLRSGEILRPLELVALPGGKGVNAARAAARLGGPVLTTGIAGGHAGRWIEEALAAEGLAPHFTTAAAESRTTYVVVDRAGDSLIVYERSTAASQTEWLAFLDLLEEELLPISARAIVAGSIPAGIEPGGHARIVEACRRAGVPLLVDASGAGLLAALEARPELVKIGRQEALEAAIIGRDALSVEAALALVDRGAELAVVTDGAGTVAAADAGTIWQATVPAVEAVNAVGSGDAFNAALSLALMDGASVERALVSGVAAGAANATSLSAGSFEVGHVRLLEGQVQVSVTRR